ERIPAGAAAVQEDEHTTARIARIDADAGRAAIRAEGVVERYPCPGARRRRDGSATAGQLLGLTLRGAVGRGGLADLTGAGIHDAVSAARPRRHDRNGVDLPCPERSVEPHAGVAVVPDSPGEAHVAQDSAGLPLGVDAGAPP